MNALIFFDDTAYVQFSFFELVAAGVLILDNLLSEYQRHLVKHLLLFLNSLIYICHFRFLFLCWTAVFFPLELVDCMSSSVSRLGSALLDIQQFGMFFFIGYSPLNCMLILIGLLGYVSKDLQYLKINLDLAKTITQWNLMMYIGK